MKFGTLLFIFGILAAALLVAAVFVLKPSMLIYVFGIFAPCAVVALLEGGKRFISLGGGALALAAAGPVILVGLLDPHRNPTADPLAWTVPLIATGVGCLVAFVGPAIGRAMHRRKQGDQFLVLEQRQEELRAAWGDSLDDPKPEEAAQ
jgi:hypothetical protein